MLPMAAVALGAGEVATLRALAWSPAAVAVLAAACVAGLGMSYFSFALRAAISATSFSVIGNVCKVLTILVNLLMWDKHASARPPHRGCSVTTARRTFWTLSESGSVQQSTFRQMSGACGRCQSYVRVGHMQEKHATLQPLRWTNAKQDR